MHPDSFRVLDALFDGVVVLDGEGRVVQLNAEACRMLGVSAEGLVGAPVEQLLGAGHPVARLARSVLASGRAAVEDEVPVETRGLPAFVTDVAVSPLDDSGRKAAGAVVVLRDCTISQSLRAVVAQREALDSYGLIAAGIAHEVKNPLGGIRGAAELLGARAEDPRAQQTAALIVREVDRITSLVDELMVFARGDTLRADPLNLHLVLDGVLELLAVDRLGAGIEIERSYDPSIPEFVGDAERLTQVFLNLGRNALEAMEAGGGSLRIGTRMSLAGRLAGADGPRLPMVEISITDTGPGIPDAILDRLATPFFTTRAGGTGLGLAVAQHWVSRHEGTLQLSSRVGAGTTAKVILPLRRKT